MFVTRWKLFLLMLAVLLGTVGCQRRDGPELVTVKGVVTLDGRPLPKAVIRFEPINREGGAHSVGVTDKSGRFQLKYTRSTYGALPGDHLVRITTGDPGAVDEFGNPTEIPELLPAIYHKNSTLTQTVSGSSNQFQYDLKSTAR